MLKQFYTSYYSLHGEHDLAVRVSASAPDFYKGSKFPALYPPWNIIMSVKDETLEYEVYKQKYLYHILHRNKLTPRQIYDELPNGSILLCYEKDSEFCHRRIIAELLEQEFNIIVPEIQPPKNKDEIIVETLLDF